MTDGFPVDCHVHFHRLGDVAPILDVAAECFVRISGRPAGLVGALLLTQSSRERVFERLGHQVNTGHWRVGTVSGEPQTLLVSDPDDRVIAIVNGRQVRARDGLEVLALGTCAEFADGHSLAAIIDRVRSTDAIPVLPWGFGKWWGKRGTEVRAALDAAGRDALLLGDNGGRLRYGAVPVILRDYLRRGYRVLPGTDPFPFGRDFRRVGGRGVLCEGAPSLDWPWRTMRPLLLASARQYGSGVGFGRFLANNVGIQVHNWLLTRAAQ